MLVGRTGERALLVAEQDRLDEVLGDRAAIDGDEGLARTLGRALDRAGDQFPCRTPDSPSMRMGMLDCAARSPSRKTWRITPDLATRSSKASRFVGLLLQPRDFARQRADLELIADRYSDAFGAGGLDEEVVGAGAHRIDRGVDAAFGRQHDDGRIGMADAQFCEHLKPVHVGHDEVEQQQRDLIAARSVDQVERGSAAGCADRAHARAIDCRLQQTTLHGIVVDNENRLRHCVSSNRDARWSARHR